MNKIILAILITLSYVVHGQSRTDKFNAVTDLILESPLCHLSMSTNYQFKIIDTDPETYRLKLGRYHVYEIVEFILDLTNIETAKISKPGLKDSDRPIHLRFAKNGCEYMVMITLKNEVSGKEYRQDSDGKYFIREISIKNFWIMFRREFDMDRFIRYTSNF